MDSKFNSWSNNDPTDSFTSVLIDASMKVPPLTFSFHSPCSDFPVCPVLDTLTPWYECWQKSLIENARVPPVQGSVEVRATVILTEEIHTIIGRVARCGVNTLLADSRVKFFACITAPWCMSPLSPASSVSLCLLYPRGPPWHRTQDASRHYSQNSSFTFVKIFVKLSVLSQAGSLSPSTECLRMEERKIVKALTRWSHSTFWN